MKKLTVLGVLLFSVTILISCGGDKDDNNKKEEKITACSCMKDAEAIGKKMGEAGADIEAISKDLDDLLKECEEVASKDPEAWEKAMADCN